MDDETVLPGVPEAGGGGDMIREGEREGMSGWVGE